MGGATQDPITVWEHIYGGLHDDSHEKTPKFASLFSGVRPFQKDLEPGKLNKARLKDVRSEYFQWPEEAERAKAWVHEETQKGKEVYHCAHLLTGRKRNKEGAALVAALYVDGDGASVKEGIPSPTLTVESSPGRDQYYWKLTHPIPPGKAEELNKRIAYAMGADKSGWDITQLLRPPGTSNHKYQGTPTVRVTEITGESYDPEELDRMLPSLEEKSDRRERDRSRTCEEEHQEPPVLLDNYGMKVWRGENPKLDDDGEVDRSASLLKMGRVLYDAGATRKTIVEALEERDESLGWNKYDCRPDAQEQYHRIVDELERKGRNTGRSGYDKTENGYNHKQSATRSIEFMSLNEIIKKGVERPEDVVEDVIRSGKRHQIFSEAGTGKTWLATWITKEAISREKIVLYLDKENGGRIIAERLKALGADPELVDKFLRYSAFPSISDQEGLNEYLSTLDAVRPDVIIFDSWINFLSDFGMDENVRSDIAEWSVKFIHPAYEKGIASLMLDHVPKDGSRDSIGSVRKREEMDVRWRLKRNKHFSREKQGEIQLDLMKDRESWFPKTVKFSIGGSKSGFVFERPSNLSPNEAKVLRTLKESFGDEGATYSEWRDACLGAGIKKSTFDRARDRLLGQYVTKNEKDDRYHPVDGG